MVDDWEDTERDAFFEWEELLDDWDSWTDVTNANGDVLVNNDDRPETRALYEAAKAETGMPVIIGEPGGNGANQSGIGLWLPSSERHRDLSAFWRAYERLRDNAKLTR